MKRRLLQILAGALVIVLVIGLYKAKSDAARAQQHVRDLQTEVADAEADLRALRAEIAHLESPARVEALAERELGMSVASESAALPQAAIDQRLPAPRRAKSASAP